MRRYMTFAQIFLILSIINSSVRAAPVVVRQVHEVHVNVMDLAEDGTTTSQKRLDSGPSDWLASAADQMSAPTALRSPDLDHTKLHSPRSSTRLNNAPSSSELSTGPHPRSPPGNSGSSSQYSSWPNQLPANSPRPPSPEFSWPHQLPANRPRPPSPEFSWPHQLPVKKPRPPSPEFSWPSHLPVGNPRPPSPEFSWPDQLPANRPRPPSPEFSWPNELPANRPRPPSPDYPPPGSSLTGPHQSADNHPLSSSEPPRPTEPETKDFLSQLDTSRDPPSPAAPETKDLLSQLNQPGSGPSHPAEPESEDLLGHLLKGKLKRRISGSGAADSAQESQAIIDRDPKSYVFASSPSPTDRQPISGPWKGFDCSPATSATSCIIRLSAGTHLRSIPDYPHNQKRFGIA